MVDGLQREVERHEFDDRTQTTHRSACTEPGKAIFGDRRIDDAARAEFLEQALCYLVRALIFGDFLTHDEHTVVAAHFLGHGVAQCFADGGFDHSSSGGDCGIGHRTCVLLRSP